MHSILSVLSSDLPGVNPATLNGMILYYRLITKWSGLGDSTELSQVGLSHSPRRADRHAARCGLLRLHHASGCLGTLRRSSSTTSPTPRVAQLVVNLFAYAACPGASVRHVARCRLLRLRRAFGYPSTSRGSSRGSSSPTSPMMCDRVPRLLARLIIEHAPSRLSTCCPVALAIAVCLVAPSRSSTTLCTDARLVVRSHWLSPCARSLHLAARLLRAPPLDLLSGRTSSRCVSGHCVSRRLLIVRIASALLRLCRAYGRAVSTLDFLSVGRTGSHHVPGHSVVRHDYMSRGHNGYSSLTPRVWELQHVAWLVAWLIVDYFAYAARLGASARRATRHAARRTARRRLLRLHRASGCLGTSRGSSCCSSSTTSTMPRVRMTRHVARLVVLLVASFVVNFDYAACPAALARRTAHHAAHRQLLRLRCASHGSSRRSSSTTSPTPCIPVP
jgi:hypothetical protein